MAEIHLWYSLAKFTVFTTLYHTLSTQVGTTTLSGCDNILQSQIIIICSDKEYINTSWGKWPDYMNCANFISMVFCVSTSTDITAIHYTLPPTWFRDSFPPVDLSPNTQVYLFTSTHCTWQLTSTHHSDCPCDGSTAQRLLLPVSCQSRSTHFTSLYSC